jgi:hypothetical protein
MRTSLVYCRRRNETRKDGRQYTQHAQDGKVAMGRLGQVLQDLIHYQPEGTIRRERSEHKFPDDLKDAR